MKLKLTLLAAIAAFSVQAQPVFQTDLLTNPAKHHRYLAHLLSQQAHTAAKTTADKQRVTGESDYMPVGGTTVLFDTTKYYYSGTNGSEFNYDFMYFNNAYPHDINPAYYPYSWSKLDVMSDSMKFWMLDTVSSVMNLTDATTASFSPGKKLSEFMENYFLNGAPDGADHYFNSYNTNGDITRLVGITETGTTWDSSVKVLFTYNSLNQRTNDSLYEYNQGDWDPVFGIEYTYDASGNITRLDLSYFYMGSWLFVVRYDHTFYSNNKLQTVIGYQFDGTGLAPQVKDSFAYSPSGQFNTLLLESQYDGTGWVPSTMISKTLNTSGMPDTMTISTWDMSGSSWIPSRQADFTYTSYQNPEMFVQYDFMGSSSALTATHHYYYEVYNEPSSVHHVAAAADISVYPNPATNNLNLYWHTPGNTSVSIQLVNTTGQLVHAESFTWKQPLTEIGIDGLNPGLYWLVVKNNAGEVIFKQSVLKQ